MAVKIKKGSVLTSLSITPLVDVVFLLLIFFLVATRFAEEDRELDVLLPSAAEAKPLIAKPKLLFVNVDDQGRYYFEGAMVPFDQLRDSLLREAEDSFVNQSVVLRADRRCDWGHVAAVLDACHAAGISVRPATSSARPARAAGVRP